MHDSEIQKLVRVVRELVEVLTKPKEPHVWVITLDADVPIKKENQIMPLIVLTRPIAPGFMRPITLTPDHAVDVRADGSFCTASVISGDSSVPRINPTSTNIAITGFLMGDGAVGTKVVSFAVDGAVGARDVEITQEVQYEVSAPDATALVVADNAANVDVPIVPVTPAAARK